MVSTASKVRLGITLSIHVAYFACIAWQAFKQINSLTCIGGILIVASPLLSYIIM